MLKKILKHYLIFLFSVLFLLPSCTLFGFGDSSEQAEGEESYYDEEAEGEESSEEEGDAALYEEDEEGDEEDTSSSESASLEEGEDIYYIDEEDEDLMAEGEMVEEDYNAISEETTEDSTILSDDGTDKAEETGGDSFFSSTATAQAGGTGGGAASPAPAPRRLSYKKIKEGPYQAGAFLVNAVYIARPGENLNSISNKIFGSEDSSQLKAINPHLKLRQVKAGDKIYYQSPLRPQDSSQILFYPEDRNLKPLYYQVQAGQNIREVAKELLGHDSSWKEIWATNPNLQSKWTVRQAIEIKYWPLAGGSGGGGEVEDPSSLRAEEEAAQDLPLEEEDYRADAEEDQTAMAAETEPIQDDSQAPPPPPPAEQAPGGMEQAQAAQKVSGFSKMFQSTDVVMGLALAFVAFVAFFVVMRKRKRKQNFDYTATNFEIEE